MFLAIPAVLNEEQLATVRASLNSEQAPWVDGRVSAGHQGVQVKNNQQLDEASPMARELKDFVLTQLERHALFISAVLPNKVYPPMFNRYGEGMQFGTHVDGTVRMIPGSAQKLRTDLSATLFLSDADSYDGGELQMEDTHGMQTVKLAAGDMVLYPATSLHQVTPITRGVRVACFFWVQSLVRDAGDRALLFDMDNAIQRLNQSGADEPARRTLVGTYHNLLRKWSDT